MNDDERAQLREVADAARVASRVAAAAAVLNIAIATLMIVVAVMEML